MISLIPAGEMSFTPCLSLLQVLILNDHVLLLLILQIQQSMKNAKETKGLPPGVFPSPLEEQYILDEYPIIIGTLTVRSAVCLYTHHNMQLCDVAVSTIAVHCYLLVWDCLFVWLILVEYLISLSCRHH